MMCFALCQRELGLLVNACEHRGWGLGEALGGRAKIWISLSFNSQLFSLHSTVLIFKHCSTVRLMNEDRDQNRCSRTRNGLFWLHTFFLVKILHLHHLQCNLTHSAVWDLSVLTGDNITCSLRHGWGAVCTVSSLHSLHTYSDWSAADSRLKVPHVSQTSHKGHWRH